ncbi:uncharacterized protein LOC116424561 [Nomia melanderi]|uniref:uncharacterized protein LOC116424561 n=1 Tax=Nomia melanderi TaxID=2448451 RepID=UPI00130401DD|nr:uncharacterized protein LOC116424561 [Nomia melanderi]
MLISSILSIFLWNISLAEWIDMPQFSDEKKIYRIPPSKLDHFHKPFPFSQNPAENQFPFMYNNDPREDSSEEISVNGSGRFVVHELKNSDSDTTIHEYTNEEDSFLTSTEKQEEETDFSITNEKETNNEYYNESINSNDMDILKYLPLNILKNVHQTLRQQSTSSEGKRLFLKTFERTLITEIESRLTQTLIPGRKKRGTDHYDHSYDSHDNATGFPSLEGALMAISFLTFAVYLVRLVMLLFRNMNNPTPNPTGTTLLLGRRRKSINAFDEETVKILNIVDKYTSNF